MIVARISAVVATLGAAGLLYASDAPIRVFLLVGTMMGEQPAGEDYTRLMTLRAISAALLAFGLLGVAWKLNRPSAIARLALFAAAAAFFAAMLLIGIGNTAVASAFSDLATSEVVQADVFVRDCESGLVVMRLGGGAIFAAALLLLVAAFTSRQVGPRDAAWTTSVLFFSGSASLALMLGGGMGGLYTSSFQEMQAASPTVRPDQLATALSGIILSVYIVVLALAGLSMSCVVLGLIPSVRTVSSGKELANS